MRKKCVYHKLCIRQTHLKIRTNIELTKLFCINGFIDKQKAV